MAAGDVITIVEDNMAKKGVYFDGTDDYILADAHAVARVAANDTVGTYSMWFYADSLAFSTLLSAGDNDNADQSFRINLTADGHIQPILKVGGAVQFQIITTSTAITARTWNHISFVQNGTQPVIYLNGVLQTATNSVATDLTAWYDELSAVDKFALGVFESNGTHTGDWNGAIGQVKYWNRALSAAEVLKDYNGEALYDDATYLQFNITMNDDGTTDSGVGADNGTLTGHAHYGGLISSHSRRLEANTTGHAAEKVTTYPVGPSKLCSVIVRGD